MRNGLTAFAILACATPALGQKLAVLEGITFFDENERVYLPAREVSQALDWKLHYDKQNNAVYLNNKKANTRVRQLSDGSALIPLDALKGRGLEVTWDAKARLRKVRYQKKAFYTRVGSKRVVINKKQMMLSAWQGTRRVLLSPVTLGIEGHLTPSGIFEMQGYRSKLHKSKIYKNAPMPWAVHIVGNIFVHGWHNFSQGRGSHGCIRLPMDGGNKARWFYYWIEQGTPVSVLGKWPKGAKSAA